MYEVKKLSEKDFIKFADIVGNAFPFFNVNTSEEKEKFIENSIKIQNESPTMKFYGAFKDEELLGGMRFHDFKLRMLTCEIDAGGVGLVAVDIDHKKEKVAKEMLQYYIRHYREKGCPMVMLYPFRPDFYKKMGFGFGTSMNQFRVKPSDIPSMGSKGNTGLLRAEDTEKLSECYERCYNKTNGLIMRSKGAYARYFNNPKTKVVGCWKDGDIRGYIIYTYKFDDRDITDIIINEMMFENREAMGELMTYLNTQSDQIRYVIFNTQDENFRFLLDDPRNDSNNRFAELYHECSTQGTGIMYRVADVKKLFEDLKVHKFFNGDITVKITVKDTFLEENSGSTIVKFVKGYPWVVDEKDFDVEITMDICDFSSLVTCAVDFKSLYRYGKADISDERFTMTVNSIFSSCEKPVCVTLF